MDLAGAVVAADTKSVVLRTKRVSPGPPISMTPKKAMILLAQQIFVWFCLICIEG